MAGRRRTTAAHPPAPAAAPGGLHLSGDLSLPVDTVTQVVAVLAKRGAGKTHTAAVLVEEMVDAGAQVVILDPVGVWWGLRAAAAGSAPGLPFVVIGGDHADLPLTPDMGVLAADLAVAEQVLLVFDLSAFDSKAEQNRFVTDFTSRLYQRNRAALHLVLEEADEFAPERGLPGERQMLGAVQRLVRRGRSRGIGVTLISQRSAALSKGVLTQADILLILRTTAPHDQRAIGEWIHAKGVDEARDQVLAGLSKLPTGTAWVWAPELDILSKVAIRARRTFDSSATPTLGCTVVTPTAFADVDIAALGSWFTTPGTVGQPDADHPGQATAGDRTAGAALVEQNRALTAELAAARSRIRELEARPPEVRQVPVADPDLLEALRRLRTRLADTTEDVTTMLQLAATAGAPSNTPPNRPPTPPARAGKTAPTPVPAARAGATQSAIPDGGALPKAQRLILAALAPYYPRPRTKAQVGLLSGYSSRGGGFNNALSALRTAGLITGTGAFLTATPAGLTALGAYEPLPTGVQLQQHWIGQLGKAPGLILQALCAAWPASMSKADIGQATGYEAGGGSFNNALSKLRTLELITGRGDAIRASDDLRV